MNTRIGSFRLWQTVVGQNIYKVFISRHRKLSLQLHASNAPRLNEPLRQQSCLIVVHRFETRGVGSNPTSAPIELFYCKYLFYFKLWTTLLSIMTWIIKPIFKFSLLQKLRKHKSLARNTNSRQTNGQADLGITWAGILHFVSAIVSPPIRFQMLWIVIVVGTSSSSCVNLSIFWSLSRLRTGFLGLSAGQPELVPPTQAFAIWEIKQERLSETSLNCYTLLQRS